jgi:hypothetical protein
MTKIVWPDARTLLGQTREENQRLRKENATLFDLVRILEMDQARLEEELAKVREEKDRQMRVIREETEWYREQLRKAQQRLSAQLPQVARSE